MACVLSCKPSRTALAPAQSRIPRQELRIQCDMTGNDHPQAEFLRNKVFSTTSHYFRRLAIAKQAYDARTQFVRRMRRHQESAPAVADHLATTWHACRYNRETGESRLKQRTGNALTVFCRERKEVG